MADLLEAQQVDGYRVAAYRRAANTLLELEKPIDDTVGDEGLEGVIELPGIGRGIGSAIVEMVTTGRWAQRGKMQIRSRGERDYTAVDEAAKSSQPTRGVQPGRRRLFYWIAGIFVLLVVAVAAAGPIMSRVEQPDYKIEASDGSIEVRSYGPMIAAEAVVEGERKAAINEGFRLIAAYIFGANKPNAKIAMTAPVEQQKQTIAMTAPVTQQASGNAWTVRFIMPKSWTMETLPTPNDARVTLKPISARRFVAIMFSGIATDEAIEKRTDELRRYASEHKLSTKGEPLLAFYNPPWTLPFFRRNEVMLELAS